MTDDAESADPATGDADTGSQDVDTPTDDVDTGSNDANSGSNDANSGARSRPVALDDGADLDGFLDANGLALVEFYTEGCGICAQMEPVLGLVARASSAAVATINPRDDPPLVERFDVRAVPTLALFVDGEEVARLNEGFVGAEDLVAFVRENAPERDRGPAATES